MDTISEWFWNVRTDLAHAENEKGNEAVLGGAGSQASGGYRTAMMLDNETLAADAVLVFANQSCLSDTTCLKEIVLKIS